MIKIRCFLKVVEPSTMSPCHSSFGHINSQPHRPHGPTPRHPSFEKTKVRKERKKRTTRILVQKRPDPKLGRSRRRKIPPGVMGQLKSHGYHSPISGWLPGWVTQKLLWFPTVRTGCLVDIWPNGEPMLISPVFVGSNCHCSTVGNLGQRPCIDGNDPTCFFVG